MEEGHTAISPAFWMATPMVEINCSGFQEMLGAKQFENAIGFF
jgi:hypothetical protein